jgi:hypothetical protein
MNITGLEPRHRRSLAFVLVTGEASRAPSAAGESVVVKGCERRRPWLLARPPALSSALINVAAELHALHLTAEGEQADLSLA